MNQEKSNGAPQQPYRLLTRSDLDGLVCAALLRELGVIEEIFFTHPKEIQDGTVDITDRDIIANLPYHPRAKLCFSSNDFNDGKTQNLISDINAPSSAHVIFNHFGGNTKFPLIAQGLMAAVEKINTAHLTRDDILTPKGWVLLGFIADSRTGLGRHHNFRISNYQLMMEMVEILRNSGRVEDILAYPDVAERVRVYAEHSEKAIEQIKKCARTLKNLLILDLRHEPEIYTVNRFMIYAMHPECSVSMHIIPGKKGVNTVFAVGKSVMNRTAKLDIGKLMAEYGGGGHKSAGTCQIDNARADKSIEELIVRIVKAG